MSPGHLVSAWDALTDESAEPRLRELERRYRRIAGTLLPLDLQVVQDAPDAGAGEPELWGRGEPVTEPAGEAGGRLLGYYTAAGLREALRRYGFLPRVAQVLGAQEDDLVVRVDTGDRFHHVMRILWQPGDRLVLELRLHLQEQPTEAPLSYPTLVPDGPERAGYVSCEWLTLQHPGAEFAAERPRLPGQMHPGLGLGAEVQTLLLMLTERLRRHGLLAYPAWFHTAVLYARRFWFLDPLAAGQLLALCRAGAEAELSLGEQSWALELGCVWLDGAPYTWAARELLFPLSDAARAYFGRQEYADLRDQAAAQARFAIDVDLLREKSGSR